MDTKIVVGWAALALSACGQATPAAAGADVASADDTATGQTDGTTTAKDAPVAGDAANADTAPADSTNTKDTATAETADGGPNCPKNCDDGNPCTDDACTPTGCTHTPNALPCDDNKSCTAGDGCAAGVCKGKPVYWQTALTSPQPEALNGVLATDGGFVAIGHTHAKGAGGSDGWLVFFNQHGSLQSDHTYGGDGDDVLRALAWTGNGWLAVGSRKAKGSKTFGAWAVQVDKAGSQVSESAPPPVTDEELHAVVQSQDGASCLAAGYRDDKDGNTRLLLQRLEPSGTKLWEKTHGTSPFSPAWDLAALPDGGAVAVGDVAPDGGAFHLWLVRFDKDGNQTWQRTYKDNGEDWGRSVAVLLDPALQVTGYVVGGSRKEPGQPEHAWLLRTDADGKIQWQTTLYAKGPSSVLAVARGSGADGFLLAGRTRSPDGPLAGSDQLTIWRTDSSGVIKWQTATGTANSEARGLAVQTDGATVVGAAWTGSANATDALAVRAAISDGKTSCGP